MEPETTLILVLLFLALGTAGAAWMLARRVGAIVPFAFIAIYILAVGAILLVNIGVFGIVDPKFKANWIDAWLKLIWPLWAAFYTPHAIVALLACRYARPSSPGDAARLLGCYLALLIITIEIARLLDTQDWLLASEFAVLSVIFFAIAQWRRGMARFDGAARQSSP